MFLLCPILIILLWMCYVCFVSNILCLFILLSVYFVCFVWNVNKFTIFVLLPIKIVIFYVLYLMYSGYSMLLLVIMHRGRCCVCMWVWSITVILLLWCLSLFRHWWSFRRTTHILRRASDSRPRCGIQMSTRYCVKKWDLQFLMLYFTLFIKSLLVTSSNLNKESKFHHCSSRASQKLD